jgi:hypothetical protein
MINRILLSGLTLFLTAGLVTGLLVVLAIMLFAK